MTSGTQASAAPSPAERLAAIEAELAQHSHRRVPRDLRRRHLLELATEMFSEHGYADVSMDDLAARAGVSKPVIYDQFGSKEGVFVEVLDALGVELSQVVLAAVVDRTDPADLLEAGSLAFFRFIQARSATWMVAMSAGRSLDGSSQKAAEKIGEIRARQAGLMEAVILASARSMGTEPDPLELSGITSGLNGVYEGLADWWSKHPEVEPERLTEWTLALVLPGLTQIAAARRQPAT